jgi:hypothetical protein
LRNIEAAANRNFESAHLSSSRRHGDMARNEKSGGMITAA